uniref:Uncharacterized protein n=1 Tax=Brassica campestris TaxID=3711 RepID=M4DSN2_BRACM
MGDRDKEKNMDNPDTVQKALADHNQTKNLDTGRLCGWFESHHRLGGWPKRLGMSQKGRVAKGHELPKGVSNQKVRDAKGYEHQAVRGPRGTKDGYGQAKEP